MKHFGDLPKENSGFDSSKVVILPVPYDGTSTWIKGADKGPEAIIEASTNMELYDIDMDCEIYTVGIHTAKPIGRSGTPEKMSAEVYKRTKELFAKKKFPIILGGEHSVSIGAIKAAAEQFEDITIVQFDAHADMRNEYLGSKNNHACVMARAAEVAPVVQIGIRSMSIEERDRITPERVFFATQIKESQSWIYEMLNKLTKNVYVTIDLDVLDPAIMSSTGTPEPGGMLWYDLLNVLEKINEKSNIVGFDVVELCPNKYNKAPDFLAAKLVYTLINYKFAENEE